MIVVNLNRKKRLILLFCVSIIIVLSVFNIYAKSQAMQHYQKVDFSTGLVTASVLNVRQGPSTSYKVITMVYKNEYIRVFARIGDWYVIQTDKDFVGCVSVKYIKPIYPGTGNTNNNNNNSNNTGSTVLTADELEVFNLINSQRNKAGLASLKIDDELQNVARIKAQDMVDNNYFSHNSPVYGSPFNMIKSFGITYKSAGENIAGNSSNSGAVNAWMNSSGHKANILNSNYNYTGIGVVSSPKYGKIYVQMFMGK